jgi:hypothetical protein
MVFEELMSALEDLVSSIIWMLATHNATATPVRSSLADTLEQELEQPKGIMGDNPHERQYSPEPVSQPFGDISNTLC